MYRTPLRLLSDKYFKMSAPDLSEVHDFLITVARKAGDMITSAKPTTLEGLGTKKNSADLVTETDQAVEKMVSGELSGRFPDFEYYYNCLLLLSACKANCMLDSWAKKHTSLATA